MAFGKFLAVDLYDCDKEIVDSIKHGYEFLSALVVLLKMEKQAPPTVYRIDLDDPKYSDKAGVSGWIALVTSGIQLHTITPKGFVSVDIYTCGELNCELAAEFCKAFYRAGRVDTKYLDRGVDY